jgi:diketogulonate reductase-like aldo/keto reductase
MVENDNLRYTKIALNNGSGAIPALGFGTLIPDPIATRTATKAALEAGFRLLDAAERYRNETTTRSEANGPEPTLGFPREMEGQPEQPINAS